MYMTFANHKDKLPADLRTVTDTHNHTIAISKARTTKNLK